jgi:hypothetical protein
MPERRAGLLGCFVALLGLVAIVSPAWAEGGGAQPSEAPPVAPGQTYFGNTQAHGIGPSHRQWELWRLPPLVSDDRLTVAWAWTGQSDYENTVCLALDVDDFSWGNDTCNGSSRLTPSATGSERATITVPRGSANAFLEFSSCCGPPLSGPYRFVVEAVQHALGISFVAMPSKLRANGVVRAAADLASGAPVPDGLRFTLSASWQRGSARTTALSTGGTLAFQLRLPRSARGQVVSLLVSRPADQQYQAGKSPVRRVVVRG